MKTPVTDIEHMGDLEGPLGVIRGHVAEAPGIAADSATRRVTRGVTMMMTSWLLSVMRLQGSRVRWKEAFGGPRSWNARRLPSYSRVGRGS